MKGLMKPAFHTLLVTGGCGFIGANFIRHLLDEAGYTGRILNVDKLTYAANPLSLADVAEKHAGRYVFVRADIADRAAMARIFDDFAVDAICHFAAESHVDRSIVRPDDFIHTNILGTYTLLQLARERMPRIKRFPPRQHRRSVRQPWSGGVLHRGHALQPE
jgi:dTDP-glucose 4,6-dehydratase